MSLQCFVSLHLLCYGAVSSNVYQEVAAIQVQTLVAKIQEGEWIQTPPRFASSPDSCESGEKWTTRTEDCAADDNLCLYLEMIQPLALEMSGREKCRLGGIIIGLCVLVENGGADQTFSQRKEGGLVA